MKLGHAEKVVEWSEAQLKIRVLKDAVDRGHQREQREHRLTGSQERE